MIRLESLILGHVNAKLFRNVIRACAFWKCALKPCISARVNQRVGAKYYLAVRRSWSWLGRHLQCMWMHVHVVQITIPITFCIAIRNVFRNVILAHVNTAIFVTFYMYFVLAYICMTIWDFRTHIVYQYNRECHLINRFSRCVL